MSGATERHLSTQPQNCCDPPPPSSPGLLGGFQAADEHLAVNVCVCWGGSLWARCKILMMLNIMMLQENPTMKSSELGTVPTWPWSCSFLPPLCPLPFPPRQVLNSARTCDGINLPSSPPPVPLPSCGFDTKLCDLVHESMM